MHLYNYDLFNPVDDHVREVTMVNYLWVGTNCYSCLFYQVIDVMELLAQGYSILSK